MRHNIFRNQRISGSRLQSLNSLARQSMLYESRDKLDNNMVNWLLGNFGETEFLEEKCLDALTQFFDSNNRNVIAALETTYEGIFHIFNEFFKIDSSKKSITRLPEQSVKEALANLNADVMNWTWKIVYSQLAQTDVDIEMQKENLQLFMDSYKSLIFPMSEAIK